MNTNIIEALNIRLDAFATAYSIPVAWENIAFTPTAGSAFISPSIVPFDVEPSAINSDSTNIERGVYRVLVSVPADTGTGGYRVIFENLRSYFKRGTILTNGSVKVLCLRVNDNRVSLSADWLRYAIDIEFRSETPN